MKRRQIGSCFTLRTLPWLTIAVLAVWFLLEAAVSVSSVHGGETCMFDWDAYMEQVSKLMHHEPTRDVASGLDAVVAMGGSVDVMGSWPTWNFNYTELKGDTGPLVYPALHTWIHSALFVVSGWDARRWTTETTPKNMSGYEERTHRPAELLRNIQYGYVGLHMATLACVLGVMAAAGLLSPMGQVEDSADGSAGNAAPSASLLQRLAAGLLAFLRAQGPAVVTCALLSLSQRVRNTSVAGLFNDSWAMLLAHGCVLALVHRRFLTGCLLLSAGVAVKMNVLLLAPGVLYVLLAEGGIAFAAQHIAACGALQLLLAAPFLAAAPMEYLRRAFDLGRKFDQQWSVNWNFLPAGLFGSGLFAAALLALQVSLLLAFALSLWRAQHLPIAAVDAAANGILKPLKTIDAAGTAAAVGIAGEDRDVGAAGAVAPARTPTADPESIADNDGDADSDVTPSAANNSRLQHLRERPRGGGSTPASTASPAATRASPRDGATLTSASRTGSSSVPAFPADRGRAGPWPALKWSWARGASAPLTAQGIALALYSCNLLGIACARSLHFQFFTWYFHSLPLLLRFTRWPWAAHVAFVVALEIGWSHHPPAGWSSGLVTALHFALVAALWFAGGRSAEADEADTASGARLLRSVRAAVASTGFIGSSAAHDTDTDTDIGADGKLPQLKLAAAAPLGAGPAKGLAAPAARAASQGLRINVAAARSKPLQQLAELMLSPSPRPQSAALPAVRSAAAVSANRQRDL